MTFLSKSSLLAGLLLFSCVLLFLLPLPYNHELASIINKRDMLKRGRGGRIIFVGGSGLYDGLDSVRIRSELGRPVVNLGLYGGFGTSAILREIEPYIGEGDVVVLVPEYAIVMESFTDETRKWLFALSPFKNYPVLYGAGPRGVSLFLEDFFSLLRAKVVAVPKLMRRTLRSRSVQAPERDGYVLYAERFNPSGDSLKPFRKVPVENLEGRGLKLGQDYIGQDLRTVNDFGRLTEQRGARAYYVFPAYPREEYLRNKKEIDLFRDHLRSNLAFPVLGEPVDFTYPYDWFTNTVNHLTKEGKDARTERIISILRKERGLCEASGKTFSRVARKR